MYFYKTHVSYIHTQAFIIIITYLGPNFKFLSFIYVYEGKAIFFPLSL